MGVFRDVTDFGTQSPHFCFGVEPSQRERRVGVFCDVPDVCDAVSMFVWRTITAFNVSFRLKDRQRKFRLPVHV